MINKEIVKKKIFLRTFGCQMNDRDSELLKGLLINKGFQTAQDPKDADVVIFNTCAVRKHAEERVFSNMSELIRLKDKRPQMAFGIIGCMARSHKDKIFERLPRIDLVAGPQNIYDIPGLIEKILEEKSRILAVSRLKRPFVSEVPEFRQNKITAYVSTGEGCDNFCSYCIVPFVRGPEASRPVKHIMAEVRSLIERGYKDITLLGQNVNSYGKDLGKGTDFVTLLEKINGIKGRFRIRFVTSHPKDAKKRLFLAMRDLEHVCEWIHLPLQSGSDIILKKMNRGYDLKSYLQLVDEYRKIVPGSSITTDLLTGFPTETEADFKKTFDAVKKIEFDSSFIFKYSSRPPAAASRLEDDVPKDIKEKRHSTLLELQKEISRKKNEKSVGMTYEVLAEGVPQKGYDLIGRTRANKYVLFNGKKSSVGQFMDVEIKSATTYTLRGEMI